MGSYATTTSLSELVPFFLIGNTTSSDTAGTNIFSRHIDRAEGVINSYVTARYSLPFIIGTTTTNVPPLLRTLSEDIACYYLMRGAYTQDGQNRNEYITEYKLAMETLDLIKEGEIKLSYTDGSMVPTLSNTRVLASSEDYTPIFGLDDPANWARDEDEIDDQESARA